MTVLYCDNSEREFEGEKACRVEGKEFSLPKDTDWS